MALKIRFVGSDYPLAAGKCSIHPEYDLFQLPSLLNCHTLQIGMQLVKEFLHLPKEEWIFFSSKITIGGDLTLQVLLIWTVSSLGGFPSSSPQPQHSFLPQTHISKYRHHTSRIFCLYHKKTTDLGTQQLGGHYSLSESSGVLAKWNPCDENDQM